MHLMIRSCVLLVCVSLVKSQVCTLESFLKGDLHDSNFDTHGLSQSYDNGKQVRVSCLVGFTGFFKLICTDGQWTSRGTKCQRRSCGHPGEAQFADFHLKGQIDDFVFGSQVEYICHKGYQMVSRRNYRNCMANGWDGMVPVCEAIQCPVILVDNKVKVMGNPEEAAYGNVVRFSCRSSMEVLNGPVEVYCDESGEWSGVGWKGKAPICEEIKCTAPAIANGFVPGNVPEYKENEVLHFRCNEGFKPRSGTSSKCTKVGEIADWSPTPECETVRCELELPPHRGTTYEPASRSLFSAGDHVSVTCGANYWVGNVHNTSARVTCQKDGTWSTRPVCLEVICSNRRDPLIEWWHVRDWHQKRLGDKASYGCISGYKATAPDSKTECTRDGWIPKPPCKEIKCQKKLYQFADIYRNSKSEYRFNEEVEYVCKNEQNNRFSLRCGRDGWIGSSTCRFLPCRTLNIQDAVLTPDTKSHWFDHGNNVQYSCTKSGENLNLTCENGAWSGIKTCTAHKPCKKAEVQHGFVVSPSENTAYYTCEADYKLPSKGWWAVSRCEDGKWSGLQDCVEKTKCGAPPVISHGKATPQLTNDQILDVTCSEGYTPEVQQINCQGGQWRLYRLTLKTVCRPVAVHCSPPPRVENAVILTPYRNEFLSGSVVTYQCRENYTMEGENRRRCEEGKWDDKSIACIQKPCQVPEDTPNGAYTMIFGEKFVYGTTIKYTCDNGFQIVGDTDTRTCLLDGWSGSLPICERASCKLTSLPPGVLVTGSPSAGETMEPGHTLQFNCSGDQLLNGTEEVTCLSTGKWSTPFPSCSDYCKVPELPPNVDLSVLSGDRVMKGERLSFSCRLRTHVVQGNAALECLANGEWSGTVPTCGAPGQCDQPPPLENGDIINSLKLKYANNEKVEYRCQRYYVMESGSSRTCYNGQWIGEIRCLKPCTVDKAAMNRNNIQFRYTYDEKIYSPHNDEVEFMCKTGRPVSGVPMRQTCLDGEITLPSCQ